MLLEIFPIFGLIAFILLWTHTLAGAFEPWLRQRINLDAYVRWTAMVILFCIILHPLILLLGVKFNIASVFSFGTPYIWLGIIGWCLLLTYDIGKLLQKKQDFFVRHWQKILLISNIGFVLIFFHSLNLGEDFQSGFLRYVWLFLGSTAIAAIAYTYVFKKLAKNRAS